MLADRLLCYLTSVVHGLGEGEGCGGMLEQGAEGTNLHSACQQLRQYLRALRSWTDGA